MNRLSKFANFVFDLFFPLKCISCGAENEDLEPKERWICQSCVRKIPLRKFQTCPVCEEYSDGGITHFRCRGKTFLEGLWVASEYKNKIIGDAIKKLKYDFIRDLAFPVSKIIERSVYEAEEFGNFHDLILSEFSRSDEEEKYMDKERNKKRASVIVPVPLHKKRYNWRGFNQAELISEELSLIFKLEIASGAIIRIKNTKPQMKIGSLAERRRNIEGAFFVEKAKTIKDKDVIIVDDVSTTLSTIDECAKAVKKAGAKNVWGLVAARR